jgi:hypothetical protein
MAAKIGKISVTTTTALQNKVANYARTIIQNRLDKVNPVIRNTGAEVIEKYVLGHRVIRALLGYRSLFGVGYDLQAEFGLTSSNAKFGVEIIVKVLKKALKYKVDKTFHKDNRGARVDVIITALDEPDYYDQLYHYGEPLNYTSRKFIISKKGKKRQVGKTYPVNWIQWLLEADRGIGAIVDKLPSIRDYGITYDLYDKDDSRSGRAIMINMRSKDLKTILRMAGSTSKDSSFPYAFPKGAIPARGAKNFVEEIARDPSFRKEMKERVFKELQKALPRTR